MGRLLFLEKYLYGKYGNCFLMAMILAPLQWVEMLPYPNADQQALAIRGTIGGDSRKLPPESLLRLAGPRYSPCDAVVISGTGSLLWAESGEIGAGSEVRDQMPEPETRSPFVENLGTRRLPEPKSLRPGECGATGDLEYRELFGPNGPIQRCKEQFVESGFSPRKALQLVRRDVRLLDFGRKVHEPTDVCVVAVSLVSHAA